VIVLIALFAISLVAFFADHRTIDGVSVWSKPLKFELALAFHFATLALIAGAFSPPWQQSPFLLLVAIISIAATVYEITYIMLQAAQQQRSRFNVSTSFHAAMYTLMAIGAVIILAAAGTVGVAAVLDDASRMGPPLRQAVAIGLIGGTVLTLIAAFTMGSRMTHHVGIEPSGATSFPVTGWSLSVGDLRVPHFLATHMIQAVPLAGLAAQTLFGPAMAMATVWIVAGGWAVLTLATYRQALAGLPFISLSWS
jgi:hypothetical protein